MLISLSGPDLVALKVFADNIMIPRFQRITGVGSVDIDGGTEREIRISIDPNKLESYGLNIKDLYDKLKKASINFPAGYVREGDKEYLVRVFGEVKTLEDELSKTKIENMKDHLTGLLTRKAFSEEVIKIEKKYTKIN